MHYTGFFVRFGNPSYNTIFTFDINGGAFFIELHALDHCWIVVFTVIGIIFNGNSVKIWMRIHQRDRLRGKYVMLTYFW